MMFFFIYLFYMFSVSGLSDQRCEPGLSPAPMSSGPWRKEVDLCRVPFGWCLKTDEESSSRVQPRR